MSDQGFVLVPWDEASNDSEEQFLLEEETSSQEKTTDDVTDRSSSTFDSGLDLRNFESPVSSSGTTTPPRSSESCLNVADSPPLKESDRESKDTGESLSQSFLKMYHTYSRDENESFDGVDSPRRLYNRRPSCKNTCPDRVSELSCMAMEFVPKNAVTTPVKLTQDILKPSWMSHHRSKLELPQMFPPAFSSFPVSSAAETPFRGQTKLTFPSSLKSLSADSLRRKPAFAVCVYCQRSGLDEFMFTSHCLRHPITKDIICPILKKDLCKVCDNNEDWRVHTQSECNLQSNFKGFI